MGKTIETSIVVNATLFWPNLHTKNDMSGKYQVDLGLLDDEAIKAIEGLGVVVKTDPHKNEDYADRKQFVTAKSANYPIKTFFANDIDETDVGAVGNGSEAMVKINAYSWEFKGKQGRALGISKVKITKLARFEMDLEDEEDWGDEVLAPDSESAPFDTDEFED
jgi:hypothetical protein